MSIFDDIRAGLAARRMTQAELARAIGMDEDKMSKAINRKRRFQADEIDKIKLILGIIDSASEPETGIETITARREFASRLKRCRLNRVWTIERAARGMIEAARLEYLEGGRDDPTILELDLLASRYSVTLDYLVSGTVDATHPDIRQDEQTEKRPRKQSRRND